MNESKKKDTGAINVLQFKATFQFYIPSAIETEMNLISFCFWADWF